MTTQRVVGWWHAHQALIQKRTPGIRATTLVLVAITTATQSGVFQTPVFAGGGTPGNRAPVISNFSATRVSGNLWTFSGQVTDDQSVAGLIVNLGGLPSLQGVTATVNSQGWFSVTVQLGANESGTATAQTTDAGGLASNVAWTIVN